MPEVQINKREVEFLQKQIQQNFEISFPNQPNLRFNSNPDAYSPITSFMKKEFTRQESPLKPLSPTFLRDFFYRYDESKKIRESSLDRMYQFLFRMNRSDYIGEISGVFSTTTNFCYSINIPDEKERKLIRKSINGAIEFRQIEKTPLIEIEEQYVKPNTQVVFYIDQAFLNTYKTLSILHDLFVERFLDLVLEYRIKFLLSDELVDGDGQFSIYTVEGQRKINDKIKKNISESSKKESKLYSKNFEAKVKFEDENLKSFAEVILDSLLLFMRESKTQDLMTVTKFLPAFYNLESIQYKFLKESDENVEQVVKRRKLTNIYEITDNESNKKFNFFCVIGYNGYLRLKEKNEMLRYFYHFQTQLKDHRIVRVFPVRSILDKEGQWRSNLTIEENKLLFQYVLLNYKGGVETKLIMFDENKANDTTSILWNQDYVLRLPDKNVNEGTASLNEVFRNYLLDKEYLFDEDENYSTRLYFGYPQEFSDTENSMLEVRKKAYIEKFYQDFQRRILLKDNPNDYTRFFEFSEKFGVDKLRQRLSLNNLKDDVYNQLITEVDMFVN